MGPDAKTEEPASLSGGCMAAIMGSIVLLVLAGLGVSQLVGAQGVLGRASLSAKPVSFTIQLDDDALVRVWADLDMRHEGISSQRGTDLLPHVLDYVLQFEGGGVSKELRCDPFDSHIFLTSGTHSSMGEASGRNYDGLLDGCAVQLPAGAYTVRAWRDVVKADGRFRFAKTDVVLRAR